VKDPATISRDESGLVTMSHTKPSPDAVGAHDVSAPVVALHAASSVRGWPLLERKFLPAYTVSPMNEKARTCPSVRECPRRQRTRRDVEGGHVCTRLAVDGGEVAAEVDGLPSGAARTTSPWASKACANPATGLPVVMSKANTLLASISPAPPAATAAAAPS
jgi:hypothetical protein